MYTKVDSRIPALSVDVSLGPGATGHQAGLEHIAGGGVGQGGAAGPVVLGLGLVAVLSLGLHIHGGLQMGVHNPPNSEEIDDSL